MNQAMTYILNIIKQHLIDIKRLIFAIISYNFAIKCLIYISFLILNILILLNEEPIIKITWVKINTQRVYITVSIVCILIK